MVEEELNIPRLTDIKLGPPPDVELLSSASVIVDADTCYLEIIGDIVRKLAILAGCEERIARSIELAVDEMVSNAVIHGYNNIPQGKIKIDVHRIKNGIIIILEEKGRQFDPLSASNPDVESPLSERKIGGLGLYIVRKIADELYFQELQDMTKRFTFIKRIPDSTAS